MTDVSWDGRELRLFPQPSGNVVIYAFTQSGLKAPKIGILQSSHIEKAPSSALVNYRILEHESVQIVETGRDHLLFWVDQSHLRHARLSDQQWQLAPPHLASESGIRMRGATAVGEEILLGYVDEGDFEDVAVLWFPPLPPQPIRRWTDGSLLVDVQSCGGAPAILWRRGERAYLSQFKDGLWTNHEIGPVQGTHPVFACRAGAVLAAVDLSRFIPVSSEMRQPGRITYSSKIEPGGGWVKLFDGEQWQDVAFSGASFDDPYRPEVMVGTRHLCVAWERLDASPPSVACTQGPRR